MICRAYNLNIHSFFITPTYECLFPCLVDDAQMKVMAAKIEELQNTTGQDRTHHQDYPARPPKRTFTLALCACLPSSSTQ
jgi:hypothetical protein